MFSRPGDASGAGQPAQDLLDDLLKAGLPVTVSLLESMEELL